MARCRALVVEDSVLLVGLLEEILDSVGVDVVGPAGTLDEALQLATAETFHFAILDINLHGEMVFPVADALTERGIPFFFASGYLAKNVVPPRHAEVEVIPKPYDMDSLMRRLGKEIERAGASMDESGTPS